MHVSLTISEPSAPFSDLCTRLTTLLCMYTSTSLPRLQGGMFHPYEEMHFTNFLAGQMSLPLHINLSHAWHLTDSGAICCMLLLLQVLPPAAEQNTLLTQELCNKETY